MNVYMKTIGIGFVAAAASVCVAAALQPESGSKVLRGEVSLQSTPGANGPGSPLTTGQWVQSLNSDTTLRLPGAVVRMDKGTSLRYGVAKGSSELSLAAKGGRIYVSLDDAASCEVASPKKRYRATQGEFVLDTGKDQVYRVEGDVQVVSGKAEGFTPMQTWSKGEVALDGPDVRRRNRNRRRFTQGEENKGKRIGEDLPPSSSPSATPTVTESPAYTPSATPSFTPSASASPVDTTTTTTEPAAVGGGPDPFLIGLGVAGAGGAAYGISRLVDNNSNDPVQIINRPASP